MHQLLFQFEGNVCLPEQEEGASLKFEMFWSFYGNSLGFLKQLEIYFITRKCGKNENKQSIKYVLTGIVENPQRNTKKYVYKMIWIN